MRGQVRFERRIGLMKQHEEFSVDEFRAMLGVPEGKLDRFAEFNKHCLKPALAEVNQLTDFDVEVLAIKKGRIVGSCSCPGSRSRRPASKPPSTSARRAASAERRLKGTVEVIAFSDEVEA